jgi:hypothetical protein
MILIEVLTKRIVNDGAFTISELSRELPKTLHSVHFEINKDQEARLSEVLHKMGSENTYGCAQNSKNGFSFGFLHRYHKDGDDILNRIV